jgi:arylsulfatase A-like enzyme
VLDLRRVPLAEVTVAPDSLGDRAAPTDEIPLDAGWQYAGKAGGGSSVEYTQRVPVKPRGLFFFRETPGVSMVTSSGDLVPYKVGGTGKEPTWSYDRDRVRLFLPKGSDAPADDAYRLRSPLALGREERLHRRLSELDTDAEFVVTRVTEGITSRSGLLLPAPSTASWDLVVPAAAELELTPGLVSPEILRGRGSDGAELVVTVSAGGERHEVLRAPITREDWTTRRVNLSSFSGQHVRLTFETTPAGTVDDDFVFVEAPTVRSRRSDARRVVFVFIDTLRADHLSLYGYERDTSKAIDHLGDEAAVFTSARTIAPWTLPSSRSVLTGRYPDRWSVSRTLQERLSERGFATGFIAGNVYLTSNFQMDRDFDYHQEDGLFPSAESTTDDALAWLDAHDGRDAFLQVHYMSAHLPYKEPVAYRYTYAGIAPSGLADGFELGDVRRVGAAQKPELQQYIRDRYDNNIRYATDQVQRLLERLDDDDIVVLYADHGEEFWDHGGYEHGHTLFDELLHVPLVIKARGMPAGRYDQDVSLLDIAPTVLDLLALPPAPELDGRSLTAVRDPAGLPPRDVAVGWPLYGQERWGVVTDTEKWTTTEGREALFDLAADPGEGTNLIGRDDTARGAPYRDRAGRALGRVMKVAWRFQNTNWKPPPQRAPPLWTLCSVPGGFSDAWVGDDPLDNMHASATPVSRERAESLLAAYGFADHVLAPDAGAIELCWQGEFNGPREIYVVPERPLDEVGGAAVCSTFQADPAGGAPVRATLHAAADRGGFTRPRQPVGKVALGTNRMLWWQFGIAPAPTDETEALDGRDAEADAMLSLLGYVEKDVKDQRGQPCEPPAP